MTINLIEIVSDTAHLTKQKITEVIRDQKDKILYVAYALHDKDKYTTHDEENETTKAKAENRAINTNIKAGEVKNPHYHVMICFVKEKRPSSYATIANWFGLPENCVNKCNSKKKTTAEKFDDMCAYLCHLNAEDKQQYDLSEVWSNFDFRERIERWKSKTSISLIIKDIIDGKITEKNYTDYISGEIYTKYKGKIEAAFGYCRDKSKTLNRKMDVILLHGPSGVGKTTYAKMLAAEKGFDAQDIFVTGSGEDMLCGYCGEGCIIVDDFRKDQMSFVDFLKMTDNNTNSTVRSRYFNKNISNCKLMLVTSIHSLDTMFWGCTAGEDMVQLYRRFKLQLKVDVDTITPYAYVKSIQTFLPATPYSNPVKTLINSNKSEGFQTEQDIFDFLGVAVPVTANAKTLEELGEDHIKNSKSEDNSIKSVKTNT